MKPNYLLLLLGFVMACSNLSGIEILNTNASMEGGLVRLSWQVHNDSQQPLYLLNIDNPLIEKKEDILYLHFTMIDTSNSLILREVPFRSKVKRIEGNQTYDFHLEMEPSQLFETPELGVPRQPLIPPLACK